VGLAWLNTTVSSSMMSTPEEPQTAPAAPLRVFVDAGGEVSVSEARQGAPRSQLRLTGTAGFFRSTSEEPSLSSKGGHRRLTVRDPNQLRAPLPPRGGISYLESHGGGEAPAADQ
jgi:hypothetical protein